jgi:hypothetical protein
LPGRLRGLCVDSWFIGAWKGAVGHFGGGRGGRLAINRRTANAFALKHGLDPHREGYVPLDCGGHAEWA